MARGERRPNRLRSVRERIARLVRALFGGRGSGPAEDPGPPEGGVGVREPRRPGPSSRGGAVALEAPPAERRDTWAVGTEDS
jgi:hypothetical protein